MPRLARLDSLWTLHHVMIQWIERRGTVAKISRNPGKGASAVGLALKQKEAEQYY